MINNRALRTFPLLVLMVVAFVLAQTPAWCSPEYIKHEMNMEFDFDGSWDLGSPARGDYFWMFSQMTFDLFAVNKECDIDAFMVYETNKKGSVAAYTNSEKDFLAENGVQGTTGFESWGGRIVGYNLATGPAAKIGVMKSRAESMGSTAYTNKIYSIVNNGNLITFVISAPKSSWSGSCGSRIDKLVGSFTLSGEPDPREKGIASYYERTTGSSLPVPGENSSSDSKTPSLSDVNKLRNLLNEAMDKTESDDVYDILVEMKDILDDM